LVSSPNLPAYTVVDRLFPAFAPSSPQFFCARLPPSQGFQCGSRDLPLNPAESGSSLSEKIEFFPLKGLLWIEFCLRHFAMNCRLSEDCVTHPLSLRLFAEGSSDLSFPSFVDQIFRFLFFETLCVRQTSSSSFSEDQLAATLRSLAGGRAITVPALFDSVFLTKPS